MPGSGQLGSGEPGRGLAAGRAVRRQGRAGPRAQPRGGCGGGIGALRVYRGVDVEVRERASVKRAGLIVWK